MFYTPIISPWAYHWCSSCATERMICVLDFFAAYAWKMLQKSRKSTFCKQTYRTHCWLNSQFRSNLVRTHAHMFSGDVIHFYYWQVDDRNKQKFNNLKTKIVSPICGITLQQIVTVFLPLRLTAERDRPQSPPYAIWAQVKQGCTLYYKLKIN